MRSGSIDARGKNPSRVRLPFSTEMPTKSATFRSQDTMANETQGFPVMDRSLEHLIDWSRSEPYQVIRGEGECAV